MTTPAGYYLKTHPLVELRTGKRDSMALIRMLPHVYVAEIMEDEKAGFIAVFLERRDNERHVLKSDNLHELLIKACAYDRLTSTLKG